jgi:hypothetical protein
LYNYYTDYIFVPLNLYLRLFIVLTMKKLLLCSLTILFSSSLFGQTFYTDFYGMWPIQGGFATQTSDGGYMSVGSTSSGPVLYKTNTVGDTTWTKSYPFLTFADGTSVQQTNDGGYIFSGRAMGQVNQDALLVKTDSLGDTLWVKHYDANQQEYFQYVQQTSDGGYIAVGATDASAGNFIYDAWVLKTLPNGDEDWRVFAGGAQQDYGTFIDEHTSGNFIMTGKTESFGAGGEDGYIVSINNTGSVNWFKTYGGANDERLNTGIATSDGGYIFSGQYQEQSIHADTTRIWILKTDVNGDTLWSKKYHGIIDYFNILSKSITQTSDGGYAVGAIYNTDLVNFTYNDYNIHLLKLDANGDSLWAQGFAPIPQWVLQFGVCVEQTSDGGYILAGAWFDGALSDNIFLLKTDSMGMVVASINEEYLTRELEVYPNPFSQTTMISLPKDIPTANGLIVFDISGRTVFETGGFSQSIQVNLKDCTDGIYFYQVFTEDQTFAGKLVVR